MAKKSETESTPEAAERLGAAREKFSEVVDTKIRGIKDGAGKASRNVKDTAEKVSAGAREKYEGAREGARERYDKVTKDLEHLGQDVNEYVRQNPGKAVAIALGAGFVLGILMRGRRD